MGIIEIFEKLSNATTEEYPELYEAIFKLVSDKTDLEILPLKFVVQFSKKVICDLSIENDKIREFALYILGLFLTLKKSEQVFSSSEKNEIALKIITLMKGGSNNVGCKAFWCFNQLTHIYNMDSEMAYEVLACIESVDPNSNDRFMIYYEACFLLQRLIKQNKDEMIKYAKRVAKLVFIPLSHPVSKIRETSYVTLNLFLPSMLNSQKEVSIGLVQIVSGTYIKDLLHLYALKKERFVLNIWKILVKLLGNSLHKGCLIINKLLDVPELGFKHASPEIKLETYTVWRALIDNFALDLHVLCNTKRLSLLLQPLQKPTDFSESIVSAKCITWWHILWCLKDRLCNHFEQVGIPLLEYALGISLTERSELQSVSNGLRPRFLKIKGCELLIRVLERPNNVPFLLSRKKSRASFPALKVPLQITTVIRLFKVFVKASRLVLEEFGNDPKLWGHIDYLLKSFVIIIFTIPEESTKDTISSASLFFQLTWDIVQGQLCPPIICLKLIERLSQFPCRMLTAHYYHVGNTEVMHGNLATSLLTMLMHPALLAVSDFNNRLTTIFCRLAKAAIQGSLAPLGYAQHVTKLIKNPTVLKNFQGEMLLNMWTDIVTALLQTLQKSQEVNQSSSIDTDFTYMNIILAYPIECCFALNITPMRTKCALNLWTDLYKYFYRWASLVPTLDANVASQGLCAEIRMHLKSENLKNSRFFNSLCQLVQVIVEQMDFDLLNNANNEGGNFEMCKWVLKRKEPLKSITSVVDIIVLLLDFFVDEIIHEEVYKLDDLNEAQKMESAKMSLTVLDILIAFFSSITSSTIVLSAVSRFAKPLSRLFMFQYRKNFNTKMHLHAFPNKVIFLWKTIARCIQLHYKGPYDSDFLAILSPLLESTLLHCRQAIRDSSRKFWLANFSYKQSSLNYPCSLKNVLLKVKPSLVSGLETSPTAEISSVPSSIELQECFRVSPVNTHNFKLLSSDNAEPDDPVCKSVNLNIRKKGNSKAIARNLNFSIDELPDEAFTKVASVPKKVVFTSHQMERRKRRSYVPALYNDLSQNSGATDSLSDMQDNTCTADSMNIVEVTSPCDQLNKKLKVSVWPHKSGSKHEDKVPSSGSDMTVFPGRKSLNKEVEEKSNKNERGTVVQKDLENKSESQDDSMKAIEELESVTISESENDLGRKQDSILNSTVTNISRDGKIIDYEKESVKENIDTNVLEFHSNEATHTEELKNLQQTSGKIKERSGLQVNEDIAVAADSIEKEENVMKKNKNIISNSCSAVGEDKSNSILNTILMSTSFTESLLNVDFTQLKKNNGQELNVTESTVLLNDSEGIIPSSQTNTENSVSGVKKRGKKRKRSRKPAAAKCIIKDSFDKEHVIKVAGVKKRGRPVGSKCIIKGSFDKERAIRFAGLRKRGRPAAAKCIIKDCFDKEHVSKVAGVQSNNHCSNSVVSSIEGVDTLSLPMEVKESSSAKTVDSLKNLASIAIARGEKDATKLSQAEKMIASSSLESLDVLSKTEKDHPGLLFGKNCEQQDLITGDAGSNIELHVCSTSKQKKENHCENNKFLESLQFTAINENSAKEHPHNDSKELVKSEEISSTEVICKYGKTKKLPSVPRKSERVCRRQLGNGCFLVTHNHGQTRMQLSRKMSVDPLGSVMNSHEKKKNCEGKSTSEPPSCDFVVSSSRELCVSLPKMSISEYKIQINLPQNNSPFPHTVVTKPKEKLCNTSECESPVKLRTAINCESLCGNNEKIAPADLLKSDKKIIDSSDLLTFEKQLNLPIQKVSFESKSNESFSKSNEEEIDANKPNCLDCGTVNDGSFKTVCEVDCLSSSNETLKSLTTKGSTVTVIHLANSNVEHLETLSHNKDSNIEENKTSVNDLDCVNTDDTEHLKENYVDDSDSLDDHVVVRSIESVSSTSKEMPSCDATLRSDQENTMLSSEIEHVDATETSLELSAKEAPGPKSIDILCDVKEDSKTIVHDHTFENMQAEIGKTQISSEMGKSATKNCIGKNETVIVLPYSNFKPDILPTTNKGEISVSPTVNDTSVESRTVTTNLGKSDNFNLPTDLSEKNCEYGKTDYPKFCSSESDSYTTKLKDIVMSVDNDVETVSKFISKEKKIQPSLGNLPLAKSSTNLENFIESENNDEDDGSSSTCGKSETLSSFGNDLVDSDVSHVKSGIGNESCTIELPLQVTPSTNHGSQIICCNTNVNKATHSSPEDQDVDTAKLQNIATRGAKRRKFRSPSKISLSLVKTTKNSFHINESVSKRSKNMLPKQNLAEKKSNSSHKKSCKKQNKSKRHSHLFPLENCSLQDTAGTQQLSEMYEILLKSLDSSCKNSNKFLKSINSYLKLQELKPSESQKLFQSSKLCVKKLKCLMKNLKHSNSVKNFASETSSNIEHEPKGLSCEDIDDSMLVNENLSCTSDAINMYNIKEADCHVINAGILPSTSSHGNNSILHFSLSSDADAKNNKENVIVSKNETCTSPHAAKKMQTDYFSSPLSRSQKMVQAARKMVSPEIQNFNPLCSSSIPKTGTSHIISSPSASLFPMNTSFQNSSSPSGSILKRKNCDSSSTQSTPSKKRRVSFAEPVVSGERLIESKNNSSRQRTAKRRLQLNEALVHKGRKRSFCFCPEGKEPSAYNNRILFHNNSLQKVVSDAAKPYGDETSVVKTVNFMDAGLPNSTLLPDDFLNSPPPEDLYHDSASLEFDICRPIFEPLANCKDPVDLLIPRLTSPMWTRGVTKMLLSQNVKTIGDLSTLSIPALERLPFKSPKLETIVLVLKDYMIHSQRKSLDNSDNSSSVNDFSDAPAGTMEHNINQVLHKDYSSENEQNIPPSKMSNAACQTEFDDIVEKEKVINEACQTEFVDIVEKGKAQNEACQTDDVNIVENGKVQNNDAFQIEFDDIVGKVQDEACQTEFDNDIKNEEGQTTGGKNKGTYLVQEILQYDTLQAVPQAMLGELIQKLGNVIIDKTKQVNK